MKLLSKTEINVLKSTERKKEVDEGMKLAKTVDTLREAKSKEEANLSKFRTESLKLTQTEIDSLIAKKNATQAEITALEVKRIELQAPIDLTKEWNEVRQLKQELSDREVNLINRETLVQNLEKREKILIEKEKEANNYLDEARKSYTKTDDLRNEMESRKKESSTLIEEKLKTLDGKEKDLVLREEVLSKEKTQVVVDKKELLDKGTSLIGRESKVETDTKLLFEREESIKEKENLTDRYLKQASMDYDTSETLKLEAERLKAESDKAIHQRYVQLAEKEREFGYKERDLILQRETLENDKKELEKEKIHVASQQTTLRQAWINIKNLQK